jgi:hypothetical protein
MTAYSTTTVTETEFPTEFLRRIDPDALARKEAAIAVAAPKERLIP